MERMDLFMDQFRENLKSIMAQDCRFSCYAINSRKSPIPGIKIQLSSNQIHVFLKEALLYLCDKVYSKMQLGNFPEASPKEYIEMLPCSDKRVKTFCDSLDTVVSNPELNNTEQSNYNAYMLSSYIESSPCHFITCKKLFIPYKKKNFFYVLAEENYKIIEDDIVRLVMHFDCIVYQGNCYFVTLQGKRLFGLEQKALHLSQQSKSNLIQKAILSAEGKGALENYMKKSGKASCLAHTDEHILHELENITQKNYKKIEQKYKLNTIKGENGAFHVDVSTEDRLRDFIDTVTNKRCLDFDHQIVNCAAPFVRRS